MIFTFPTPIQQFGGYLATNGGSSGGMVQFFDVQDQLIATLPLNVTFTPGSAPYTWNGWFSTVAFSKVHISSNSAPGGLLGFDDLQASAVPAPGALICMTVAAALGTRRRRRPRPLMRRHGVALAAPARITPVVQVLYGKATGLAASKNQVWHQDEVGGDVHDFIEPDDFFGGIPPAFSLP